MDATAVLTDATTRPLQALDYFWDDLKPDRLNSRPGGHPNSIAWLLWHSARQTDAQLAPLLGRAEVWHEGDYKARFGFEGIDLGLAEIGFQQRPEDARRLIVSETEEGKALLRTYLEEVYQGVTEWVRTLTETALDRVIDDSWDPPVTLGVRIISTIDDAAQHIGQAAYIAGMPHPETSAEQ